MSAEVKKEIKFEIGHVLFMDLVGFSKLLINDQSEILEQLNQLVRKTPHFREAEAADKLIRLATGDGMALVFFNSAEAPVDCALEISKALQSYPQIQLRMGVHSGPINPVSDVNDRSNVTGAGINMAQRVMDCGDAGHILLSRHVAEDLEQYRQWQPCLHDLGECEVKHGARVHVFNLYTDELGNSKLPKKFKQQRGRKKPTTATGASAITVPTPEKAPPKSTPVLFPGSSKTNLTPAQITKKIKSASPYERDDVARAFSGLSVDWTLFFSSAHPLMGHETFTSAFFEDRDEKDLSPILVMCTLQTKGHERLPLMNKTDRFRVRGTIEKASQSTRYMSLMDDASIDPLHTLDPNEKSQANAV